MSNTSTSEPKTYGQAVLRRFESYGFWIGLGGGLLVGVAVSGPFWREWPLSTSFWVIAGCTVLGATIGYFSGPIAVASETGGPAVYDTSSGDSGSTSGGDGGAASGD